MGTFFDDVVKTGKGVVEGDFLHRGGRKVLSLGPPVCIWNNIMIAHMIFVARILTVAVRAIPSQTMFPPDHPRITNFFVKFLPNTFERL